MPPWPDRQAETGTGTGGGAAVEPALPPAAAIQPTPRSADTGPPAPAREEALPPRATEHAPPAHPDMVTRQHMEVLQGSGLLARQSEIAESIIMLERQLKQAELLNRLMALRGPDVLIEVAPGEFRSFADTPAGQRLAMEQEESRLLARIRILELQEREAGLSGAQVTESAPAPLVDPAALHEIMVAEEPAPTYVLQEIRGSDGDYSALIEIDGKLRRVGPGDRVAGEMTVLSVGEDSLRLSGRGRIMVLRLDG